jgi:hypothetical protein
MKPVFLINTLRALSDPNGFSSFWSVLQCKTDHLVSFAYTKLTIWSVLQCKPGLLVGHIYMTVRLTKGRCCAMALGKTI